MNRSRSAVRFAALSLLLTLGVSACSGGSGSSLPGNVSFGGSNGSSLPPTVAPAKGLATTDSSASENRTSANSMPALGSSSATLSTVRTLDATSGEQAESSDRFVDSIGVNSHIRWGVYNDNLSAFTSALRASGIRHIREGLDLTPSVQYMSTLQSLAASGIHAVLVTDQTNDPKAIANMVPSYVPAIDALEGPNEPNPQYGNWAPALRTFIKDLYTAVKSNPAAARIPVYAPALHYWSNQNAWATLGDVSAYVDYGNIHDYTGGYVLTDNALDTVFANLNLISGSKPVVATENGYSTSTASNGLPSPIEMSYTIRMLFKQFQRGFNRTWIYQFLDESTDTTNYWDQQGLMTSSVRPKPAYTAVKNVINLLADPGATKPKSKLGYLLGGNTKDLTHVLLQKNDGTFYLVMWLNVSDFNPGDGSVSTPPAQQVSVSFGSPVSAVSGYHFDDSGNLSSSPMALSSNAIQLNVTDRVQIFKIVPSTGSGPPPSPPPTGQAPALPNTAAHWGFNEGSGATAADSVSSGAAVLAGNAYWTPGVYGSAVAIPDGSHVTAPAGLLDTSQSYSISAWLMLNDASHERDAVVVQGTQHSAVHLGYVPGRGFAFQVYTSDVASHGSVRASQTDFVPVPGTWYHVVGVFDKENCRIALYVNGTFIKNVAGCATFRAHGATEFGRGLSGANTYISSWSGAIDEVNLYQRALSQQEVTTLAHRP